MIALSTDRCAINGSIDGAAQSMDRANPSIARNKCIRCNSIKTVIRSSSKIPFRIRRKRTPVFYPKSLSIFTPEGSYVGSLPRKRATKISSTRNRNVTLELKCRYIYGIVSARIAPRLKCYKNASRLNRYNFPTITLSTSYFQHFIVQWCSMKC